MRFFHCIFAVGLLAACSSSNSGTGSTGTMDATSSSTTGAGGTTTSTTAATTSTSSTGGAGGAASTTASTGTTGAGGETCYPDDAGDSTDTWTNYAMAFFKTYCVECHGATIPNPENPSQPASQNFNLLTDVTPLKSTIRCGVSPVGVDQCGCNPNSFPPPGQFPIYDSTMSNMKPDSADRLRIVAWIDNGCPE
jgi:hypothetical protein